MNTLLADTLTISGQPIEGPLVGIENIADVVNKITKFFIFPAAGIILFFVLVFAGFELLLSGGNPEKLKSAKAKITSAVIGFVLLVLSYFIVRLIAKIFGLGEGIL